MANNKYQTAIQQVAQAIREKAENLKKSKEELASKVTSKIDTSRKHLFMMQKYYETAATATKAAVVIVDEVKNNPVVRQQIQTLVANAVSDFASRMNELSNIVDSVSKSPNMHEACSNVEHAFQSFEEAAAATHEFSDTLKPDLKIVTPDDGNSGTGTTH